MMFIRVVFELSILKTRFPVTFFVSWSLGCSNFFILNDQHHTTFAKYFRKAISWNPFRSKNLQDTFWVMQAFILGRGRYGGIFTSRFVILWSFARYGQTKSNSAFLSKSFKKMSTYLVFTTLSESLHTSTERMSVSSSHFMSFSWELSLIPKIN